MCGDSLRLPQCRLLVAKCRLLAAKCRLRATKCLLLHRNAWRCAVLSLWSCLKVDRLWVVGSMTMYDKICHSVHSREIHNQCCHPMANKAITLVPYPSLTVVPLKTKAGTLAHPDCFTSKTMHGNHSLSPNINNENNIIYSY